MAENCKDNAIKEKPYPVPTRTAEQVAASYFGIGSEKASQQLAIRQWLVGAIQSAVLIPLIFYLRFSTIDGFGWSITIFKE
jgi:hypothetical protein